MKSIKILDKYFEPTLIVASISFMTVILCLQIILRLFDTSIAWAEELARYLFVWSIYLGISYCIRDDRHIRIKFFIDIMPQKIKIYAITISDIIYLSFVILVSWYGFIVISRSLTLGQIAPALEIPIACLYSAVLISSLISCIRLVVNIINRLKLEKI